MSVDYKNQPKVDFAVFKNQYATTDRHPSEVGKIEFTREFMKAMVEVAQTGTMPVLKVAMWNRVSGKGLAYKNFRLEIDHKQSPAPVEQVPVETTPVEKTDGDLPWE